MNFDFQDPHTVYVIAAYGVAALGYAAMIVHTYFKWDAIKKLSQRP